jgi:hypothetical protein
MAVLWMPLLLISLIAWNYPYTAIIHHLLRIYVPTHCVISLKNEHPVTNLELTVFGPKSEL